MVPVLQPYIRAAVMMSVMAAISTDQSKWRGVCQTALCCLVALSCARTSMYMYMHVCYLYMTCNMYAYYMYMYML